MHWPTFIQTCAASQNPGCNTPRSRSSVQTEGVRFQGILTGCITPTVAPDRVGKVYLQKHQIKAQVVKADNIMDFSPQKQIYVQKIALI